MLFETGLLKIEELLLESTRWQHLINTREGTCHFSVNNESTVTFTSLFIRYLSFMGLKDT